MESVKISTILDGIQHKSNQLNIDISIENMFDDKSKENSAYIVENLDTNVFGVVVNNLEGHNPEDIHFFGFDPKMYTYSKAEGFSQEEGFMAFGDKILKKLDSSEFLDFIFNKESYDYGN